MIQETSIDLNGPNLPASVAEIPGAHGWVVFAHGSGSSRKSKRNMWVASRLNEAGLSTFLFDLLTLEEDLVYANRFNIPLLARRLLDATEWLSKTSHYVGTPPIGFFGASTGAGAALMAAAMNQLEGRGLPIQAVVSRGGRPDLAGEANLRAVTVPTLLLVGSLDTEVISLNRQAQALLPHATLELVEGASHLFDEPGSLGDVVELTLDFFEKYLMPSTDAPSPKRIQ